MLTCRSLHSVNNRIDRQHERKLNQETFGVSGFRNFRRGFGRGGYNNRGGFGNRNFSSNRGGYQRRGSGNYQRRTNNSNNGSTSDGANKPAQAAES